MSCLLLMKEQDLGELIPQISLRIKFRQRLDEWKANKSGGTLETSSSSLLEKSSSSLQKKSIGEIVSAVVLLFNFFNCLQNVNTLIFDGFRIF